MKLLSKFYLPLLVLFILLCAVQVQAQLQAEENRQKSSREQVLLSQKDLIHNERELNKHECRGGQHQTHNINTQPSMVKQHLQTFSDSIYVDWIANYASGFVNPSNDYARAIALDGSGNVYVTGQSQGSGTSEDYATVKYNASGVQQWIARYNGPGSGSDYARAIALDGSGNVYVTGWSVGSGTPADYMTVKYNASGAEQWIARYNGPGNGRDYAYAIAIDGNGNVFVTGESLGSGTELDYATIKYNSLGIQQWVARYNGPVNDWDQATAISLDDTGNVYVTGMSIGLGTNYDYTTLKYNSSGVQQWVARYNGPGFGSDLATAISLDDAGNVYVTGASWGLGTELDYATVKYNSSGIQQWVARYFVPGEGWDYARALALDGAGNVYVTGYSHNGLNYDYATLKYNSSGVQQWVARYNGPGNGWDYARAIALDGAGNVYVTGEGLGSGTNYDFTTVKYNSSGVQRWVAWYNGKANGIDIATALSVDGSGNVYVTGRTESTDGYQYTTIKYRQTITGITTETEQPSGFFLHQNYPNPFNPTTVISWQSPVSGWQSMKVYDVLGNEVATLVDEYRNAGSYEVEFSAKGLASGVYYYRIAIHSDKANSSFTDTKKFVLVK